MKIKDRPEFRSKPKPVTFRGDRPVMEAIQLMAERNIGSVVIVDDAGHVAGIMTERDLLRRLLAQKRDQVTTTIEEIMTKEVRVANAEDDVLDWLRQMSNDRFRHVPVVDADGNLQAIMSQGDFISYTWPLMLVQATEAAKRIFFNTTQASMIIVILIVYLIVTLSIVVFR